MQASAGCSVRVGPPSSATLSVNYTSHDALLCWCLPQVLATRILAVKASLCKLSTATAARACDFYAKLLLIAISSTLKSLLRPHVLNTPDKSPGDRLTEICAKNTDTGESGGTGGTCASLSERVAASSSDIDKVMINLKTEEFVLDGPPLQSLQQLIQWVGDFVLYLLANLPNQVRQSRVQGVQNLHLRLKAESGEEAPGSVLDFRGSDAPVSSQGSMVRPGFGFMRDGASLGMLREMLVMIRIWGLLKPGCLPTFTAMSDNQDSMQLLFRLLTKLWLCCKAAAPAPAPAQRARSLPGFSHAAREDGPPQDPDESLIDECCLLPSQLLVPSMDWLPVNDGIIVKLQGKHPLRLQFGKASSLPAGGAITPLELFHR